ncbi:hypothetical protein FRB94_009645 [Tulasnella sp. JGI-2019a]|nr:hypothetical protein FRB94_009645 [Tulasnella sp. JGI-2019a]KAG9038075.1 hypothetical protein FRB95_003003 [Tulasnella sp. JGI-2019a]
MQAIVEAFPEPDAPVANRSLAVKLGIAKDTEKEKREEKEKDISDKLSVIVRDHRQSRLTIEVASALPLSPRDSVAT